MTTDIFRHIAKKFSWIIVLSVLFASCTDERLGGAMHPETDNEGKVKVTFSLNIPGLMAPTRAAGAVDEPVETIDLFLFDENDLLTEVVHLTKNDAEESFTENDNQYSDGEYVTPEGGTTGTYSAWIDGNTSRIHFIANLPEGEFDFKEHEGGSETEVIAPLITRNRVYWGRATFNGTALSQDPVLLYRNYAKVKVGTVASGITINGWTLYHRPIYGTMAPCDRSKLSGGSSSEQEGLNPFDFSLGTSGVSLPLADKCVMTVHNEANKLAAEEEITANSASVAYWCFEYDDAEFEERSPVYAIFNITMDGETKYYRIDLLEDDETGPYGNVISRKPFVIKRNYEYTINFEGLTPDTGWDTLEEAVNHNPANNTEITVEESLPEIVSANHTLRIEETAEGASTIRYYKDYTDPNTTYTISDILVYYDGDDCTTNDNADTGASRLEVTWKGEAPAEYVENTLSIAPATDAEGAAIAHTYRVSFQMKGFDESAVSASSPRHYTEGTLCIAEQHEVLLKRYVKVYMGPAITFRPLLISSDIPNLTDERLTILFTIPDGYYLPEDLYPIEIRFGSDRVDVEKNLFVDAMKVDFGADAAQNYTHVLRWQDRDNDGKYSWTTHAANKVQNSWGYKYIHTISTPPTANEQQQRITLRTVVTDKEDFKVMMEGRSTVTGTNVFNTRELDFMMQNDGTATFSTDAAVDTTYGSWIAGTTGTTDQYQRIMLDGGLAETRYVTRYVNVPGEIGTTFDIPYTLGTLVDGVITADAGSDKTPPVLWVYYDKDKFTPTSVSSGTLGTAQTDADGNTFVAITPAASGWSEGAITFKVLNTAKNSMIFFTARNSAKYGTYDNATFADGNKGYVCTGVNALASTYRSAGALVSTVSKWDFNPAPSTTDGNYSFADKISIPAGMGQDLYVRIERPRATAATITIDTKGAFELQTAPRSVTVTNSDGSESTTPDYTITSFGNGVYTVTLNSMESDYAYLHFKTASFSSAGTISFTGELYNAGELTVNNAAIPFLAFEFAQEEELAKETPAYAKATNVVPAIKGALIGVRVYLPKALYTALNGGKDANTTDEQIFRFAFTSRYFKPVNASSTLTTALGTQSRYDYYTVTQSTKNNTTHIITVEEGALHDAGKSVTMDDGTEHEACYIDLLLESIAIESAENVKFLGANEEVTDLSFYPYNTSIACSGTYEVTIEHSADGTEWITTPLSGIKDGDDIHYRITIPDWGLSRKDLPMLVQHNGKLSIPAGSTLTDVWDGDENTFIFNATTNANAETLVVFQLKKYGNIAAGTQEAIQIVPAKDRVKLASPKLILTELQAVTPTRVALYSAKTDEETTIYENGAPVELPYLDLPVEAAGKVNIVIELGETYNDEVFTLTMKSSDCHDVGLVPEGVTERQGLEVTTTATVAEGKLTFGLQTLYAGTAEEFTLNVKSDHYILPELTQLMATSVTAAGGYNVYWTQPVGHARGFKNGGGNEIFDNQQYQNVLPVPDAVGTLASPYESYTYGVKLDGSGYISFYAPKDGMTLSAVVGLYNDNKGTLGVYKADGTQLNVGNDGKDVIDYDGTVITQTLEEAGLYYLKRSSGSTFIVYALTLSLPSAPFGDFKWYATKADGAAVSRGSGTWGAADALITANDADGDGTRDVWVSDFAQELHLTVDGLSDGETTLTISGDYRFKDGTTTQTVTPENNAAPLTLVPVTYFDANNELTDGSFTLNGYSTNFSYTPQTVDVNIRPWVLLTTNVENYTETFQDGNGYGVLIPFLNTYEMTFTVVDEQHDGKSISFEPRLVNNGTNNAGNSYFQLFSFPNTEKGNDWTNAYLAEFESAGYNTPYTFVWRAMEQGGNPIHQVKEGEYTDIIIKHADGGISDYSKRGHIYYAHTASGKSITRLRPLNPFMNAGASQGYIQYSTDGTNWEYVLGTDEAKLNAHLNAHSSQLHTLKTGTFYMRVTIPASIGDDDYANIAVKSGSTVNSNFTNQGVVTDDDGSRWVKFEVDASSASNGDTWNNLVFYDNRTIPEVGPSAMFNLKFENPAKLTVALTDADGNALSKVDNKFSYNVGDDIYFTLTTSSETTGKVGFKLQLQASNGQSLSNSADYYLESQNDSYFASGYLNSTDEVYIENAQPDTKYKFHWKALQPMENVRLKISSATTLFDCPHNGQTGQSSITLSNVYVNARAFTNVQYSRNGSVWTDYDNAETLDWIEAETIYLRAYYTDNVSDNICLSQNGGDWGDTPSYSSDTNGEYVQFAIPAVVGSWSIQFHAKPKDGDNYEGFYSEEIVKVKVIEKVVYEWYNRTVYKDKTAYTVGDIINLEDTNGLQYNSYNSKSTIIETESGSIEISEGVKMQSSTTITLNVPHKMKLTVVMLSRYDSETYLKLTDGKNNVRDLEKTSTKETFVTSEVDLSAGTYTLTRGGSESRLFYLKLKSSF